MEDGQTEAIYHSEYFVISKKQYDNQEECIVEFTVPIRDPLPPQYYIRCISDRWVGCESCLTVSFQHLILPDRMPPHTDLLDVHPVPKEALQNKVYEEMYPHFSHFNPIQSQVGFSISFCLLVFLVLLFSRLTLLIGHFLYFHSNTIQHRPSMLFTILIPTYSWEHLLALVRP